MVTDPSAQDNEGDKWFVRMKTGEGHVVIKTMLTPQMVKMVEGGTLHPSVQISRNPKEGFRALATYKEFQAVALGRTAKKGMDRQTTQAKKNLYDQIVKREIQREVKPDRVVTSANYWFKIFLQCAGALLAVGGALYVLYHFLKMIAGMF